MSILAAELKWYRSETVTDGTSNGGKMSNNLITTGVKNNIFPDVSQAERLAGLTRYRKIFAKLTNAANEVLVNPAFHLKDYTPAVGERVEIFVGDHTDTQGAYPTGDTERKYGACELTGAVTAGETSAIVTLEIGSMVIFEATGNTVFIGDATNSEYHENVDASQVGDQVTLTLTGGAQFANSYAADANTRVASVIYGTLTQLLPTFDAVVSVGSGTYDDSGFPVEGSNLGTVEDTFTLTFTDDAGAFDCSSAAVGALGSGNISGDFAPNNPSFSTPYFTLRQGGFGTGWLTNDTITIVTHPASQGIWCKQIVEAGTNSFSGDSFTIRFGGESA